MPLTTNFSSEIYKHPYLERDNTDDYLGGLYTDVTPSLDGFPKPDEHLIDNYRTIRKLILVVFMCMFFLTGVIANSYSLLVLFQKVFILNAFAIGQRFLAMLDLVSMFAVVLQYLVEGVTGRNISNWSISYCRTYKTVYFILTATSNWCITYLTVIRYLSVKKPLKVISAHFIRHVYIIMLFVSIMISLFYALFYHEFSRMFSEDNTIISPDQCIDYRDFAFNPYLYRTAVVFPETILPAIFIVLFNILTYRAYGQISVQRSLLRQEVNAVVENITHIKRSLTDPFAETLKCQQLSRSSEHSRTVSLASASVKSVRLPSMPRVSFRGRSSIYAKHSAVSSKLHYRVESAVGFSNERTRVDSLEESSGHERERKNLLRQLKTEKLLLRRATITYNLLCDMETSSKNPKSKLSSRTTVKFATANSTPEQKNSTPEQKNSTLEQKNSTPEKKNSTPEQKEHNIHKHIKRHFKTTVKQMLVISSLLFLLLRSPYCVWYIISTKIDSEIERLLLTNAVFVVLNCAAIVSNSFIYIYTSKRFRVESKRVFHKYVRQSNNTTRSN